MQSEDDEPAVKISSVIAVLSLTMQPYLGIRTDYAKWITGHYFIAQFVLMQQRIDAIFVSLNLRIDIYV